MVKREKSLQPWSSKRLQHPFDFVERCWKAVERWDEQTLSTFHSTKLSERPGNLFQAPALFTPETCRGAIMKWQWFARTFTTKFRSLLVVFVAFEVLNHENKKRGRGKTRQWIRRRDERGYFNNIVKELAIEDTAAYKDMVRMRHADFQRILSYIEQDITRKQVFDGNKVISPKERLALTISHSRNCLALLPSFHPWWPWLRLLNCACAWSTMLKEWGKWFQLRFNIPIILENKRNVEWMLKQSLKAFKLFQHRFNMLSTRFNNVERGWQTLSTLPFNKIERMLKQMLINKLTSVFHASVLLLIMNFVITLSK